MLRIPHCLDNRLIDGCKVVSLTHTPHFTPQKHYYFNVSGVLISVRGWLNTRAHNFCLRLSKPQGPLDSILCEILTSLSYKPQTEIGYKIIEIVQLRYEKRSPRSLNLKMYGKLIGSCGCGRNKSLRNFCSRKWLANRDDFRNSSLPSGGVTHDCTVSDRWSQSHMSSSRPVICGHTTLNERIWSFEPSNDVNVNLSELN
jgi:hypothetical protein